MLVWQSANLEWVVTGTIGLALSLARLFGPARGSRRIANFVWFGLFCIPMGFLINGALAV
jgi:hypothetical protein